MSAAKSYLVRGDGELASITVERFTVGPLRPQLARAILLSCGFETGTVWDVELGIGYRVYARSARKLYRSSSK